MPPSVFAGRIPTEGEPLWLDTDRLLALSLLHIEADTCSGCGHPRTESMDIDNAETYQTKIIKCHACAAREARTIELQEEAGEKANKKLVGKSVIVLPREA